MRCCICSNFIWSLVDLKWQHQLFGNDYKNVLFSCLLFFFCPLTKMQTMEKSSDANTERKAVQLSSDNQNDDISENGLFLRLLFIQYAPTLKFSFGENGKTQSIFVLHTHGDQKQIKFSLYGRIPWENSDFEWMKWFILCEWKRKEQYWYKINSNWENFRWKSRRNVWLTTVTQSKSIKIPQLFNVSVAGIQIYISIQFSFFYIEKCI